MKTNKLKNRKPEQFQRTQFQQPKKHVRDNTYTDLFRLAVIILLGAIIYSNSFNCTFHFDDSYNIVDNIKIRSLNVSELWNYSHNRFVAYYSFAINYHFDKLSVWGYHLVNLVIHLVNACLVYWLTLLIFSCPILKQNPIIKNKNDIALFTALLFVSHPLATQSVTYIVQRMASMVAMFYLLSLALYVKARLTQKSNLLRYLLFTSSFIFAALAMLTKENAFTLPFTIVLLEIFFLHTKKLSINFKDYRVILIIASLLSFILFILFRFSLSIFKSLPPDSTNDFTIVTSLNYLFTQFSVIVKYIQLLVLPVNQNLDYDFRLSNSFFDIRTIMSFLFLLSLVILARFLFKKNRIISFNIFWFFLTLSIESSIVPLSDLIFEHRTYLPSYGFFFILSSGTYALFWNKHKYLVISILVVLIGANSILTYKRNKVWKDELTLWSDVISKSPGKARAHFNRGTFLGSEKQHQLALQDYNKAIGLKPQYAKPYINRGLILMEENRNEEALKDFNKSLELNSDNFEAYCNRAKLFVNQKKYNDAISDYSKALILQPQNATIYNARGSVFEMDNKNERALDDFNKAIELEPDSARAYFNRAIVFEKENKNDKALKEYSKAIELNSNYTEAYVNRGNVLSAESRNVEAVKDFNKAIALDPGFFEAYNNRGTIFMNEKKYDSAIIDFTNAIQLRPDHSTLYFNRGISFQNQKKFDDAIKDFSQVIIVNNQDGEAFYYRGIAEYDSGKKEAACLDWQHSLGLGYQQAKNMYNKYCH